MDDEDDDAGTFIIFILFCITSTFGLVSACASGFASVRTAICNAFRSAFSFCSTALIAAAFALSSATNAAFAAFDAFAAFYSSASCAFFAAFAAFSSAFHSAILFFQSVGSPYIVTFSNSSCACFSDARAFALALSSVDAP